MKQSDGSLTKVTTGAGDDLGSLYRRYRDEIRSYVARTFGGGPPDPDDVVQVVFERFASRASGDDGDVGNVRAFLYRSARNFVIDERRRSAVRADFGNTAAIVELASDDLDAERVLDSRQRWAAIEGAISRMDSRSREMLLMNRIHGLSCAEIARRKKCSATLVKSVIARALVECHRALGEGE
ncbi:MAG: sigma-70 family RNA polymerase sigma factor [Novosphingobium sp.]|nr:sigma-70 family RNA polymerase sigma factor [Novosphingobium sp.]